jgi:hypothetical protein
MGSRHGRSMSGGGGCAKAAATAGGTGLLGSDSSYARPTG